MSPDPDAPEWREIAREMHAGFADLLSRAFAWIDKGLESGDGEAEVVILLAVHDREQGRPAAGIIADVLFGAGQDTAAR